ncbi:MAG: methyltransferase domain-containing protein [bacterium]
MAQSDTRFVGKVPEFYDTYMVPLLFQTYAEDMAARIAGLKPAAVLETAAGSGVVTRVLAPLLGAQTRYGVTDLNAPMLEQAKSRQGTDDRIEWAAADALSLPYDDASFDAVLCQFGAMFFPDRPRGYAEALRVMKPGATFVFSVWDSLADNDIPATIWQAVQAHYPVDPPTFFTRTPHGYFDQTQIRADVVAAGFTDVSIETVTRQSHAATARDAAMALVQGTPLRMELMARDPEGLGAVTDAAEAAVRQRYGDGPVAGKIQAFVVTARV